VRAHNGSRGRQGALAEQGKGEAGSPGSGPIQDKKLKCDVLRTGVALAGLCSKQQRAHYVAMDCRYQM
jgi:hypothetical protein